MRFSRTGPVAVVFVAEHGAPLAARIAAALPEATLWAPRAGLHPTASAYSGSLQDLLGELWPTHAAIVCVMASGIVVRSIAPWVASKYEDPAVVVLDDAGRFSISLLSGHEGGANALAEDLAELTGAVPVVTTGTEAARGVVLGVGSRRGVSREQVLAAADEALAAAGRTRADVRALSTIDLKADEAGIREAAELLGVPVRIVSRERIRTMQDALRNPTFAEEVTGVAAVCVPSALMSDPHAMLMTPPIARDGVTVAVAEDDCSSSASVPGPQST
jgi:cobalt-precorrin 5A hydrolase